MELTKDICNLKIFQTFAKFREAKCRLKFQKLPESSCHLYITGGYLINMCPCLSTDVILYREVPSTHYITLHFIGLIHGQNIEK